MFSRPRGQTDGEVQIGLGKIHIFIRRNQCKSGVGIFLAKACETRRQPFGGKITRRGNG